MIINRIYENHKLLSLQLVSFLVRLRTYQHPGIDIRNKYFTMVDYTHFMCFYVAYSLYPLACELFIV
jgi:hypothetical protein